MPLQNRVQPDGEIITTSARGLFMGNRGGRIHDPATRTVVRTQSSRQWICCVLKFKNRRREVMGQGYTELFFLDEVTALAAGHRPCFECRRADALAFRSHWQDAHELATPPLATEMDRVLSAERLRRPGKKVTWTARLKELPDATVVRCSDRIMAVRGRKLLPWQVTGYEAAVTLDLNLDVKVLTPASIIAILLNGYQPVWHPSADLQ